MEAFVCTTSYSLCQRFPLSKFGEGCSSHGERAVKVVVFNRISTRLRGLPLKRHRQFKIVAALVEAAPATGNLRIEGEYKSSSSPSPFLVASAKDRANDMQSEAKAMTRAANASVYTPQMLANKYGSRPLMVLQRAFEILFSLGSFGLKLWLDQMNDQLNDNKRVRAVQLRKIFTGLGPTFVKIGQGLSTRPDICPPEYLEELAELQDALPTFPDAEAFYCIEKELGLPLDSIYSSISPSPIAAASLGQVYKAQLKYSGQNVAVKVQRPGIEDAIGLDFYLIRGLGFIINKYVDVVTSDVVALVDEFARRVYQELNYVQEGQNARRFKKLYADKEDVLVPDIFWDYTSAKVLTMEWIDGVKLNQQDAIERQGLKVLDLVNIGIQCSLRQLLEYGYFHADPHPGNLLATSEGKLAFIDFGMMSETPEQARTAIIGHVVHMVNRDYEAMARDYYVLDFLTSDVDVSPLVPVLRDFFDDALNSTVNELNFKTLVDGLGCLFLYNNNLSGSLPSSLCNPTRLQNVDVSYNNLTSSLPHGIGQCHHLQRLIVSHNQFNDEIPSGVWSAMGELVQLDLSSNRFSGKIPVDLGELKSLSRSLNLSFNHLTGRIPKSLGNLPMTVSFDLRGNNLSGEIPQIGSFASQGPTAFLNNPLLCGFPLQKNCGGDNSSAPSTQDDSSGQSLNSDGNGKNKQRNRLDAGTIVLISAADAAAVAFVGLIIIYIYWKKKDDSGSCSCTGTKKLGGFGINNNHNHNHHNKSSSHPFLCCINRLMLTNPNGSPNSDSEISSPEKDGPGSSTTNSVGGGGPVPGSGELVALDKSFAFELDELLRASAYVLGKSGLGIVYKVVLGNGIPVAVRRLGEGGGDQQRYKEFVLEVNAIAKVKHPNVVRLRAYYWAPDEKLLISDFVSNGNLANVMKGKTGQSTTNLTWSTRLQIAQGTSKGLAYLHECSPRKFVHGDIKPSNILIDTNYQPYISDFGLNRLITITGSDPSSSGGLMGGALPYIKPTTLHQPNNNPSSYKAPEARFPGTRPTQKWDVYSFGVVLLELLTGKSSTDMMMLMVSSSSPRASSSNNSSSEVMNQQDLVKWVRKGFEDQIPLSEIVDPGLLNEVKAKKEVLSVFHLALACTESDPEIRPRMKNVADHLEKIRGS